MGRLRGRSAIPQKEDTDMYDVMLASFHSVSIVNGNTLVVGDAIVSRRDACK